MNKFKNKSKKILIKNQILYSKKIINLITILITIIIFYIINVLIFNQQFLIQIPIIKVGAISEKQKDLSNQEIKSEEQDQETEKEISTDIEESVKQENTEENVNITENIQKDYLWYIEIPKIGLKAEIKEGTEENIINYYVGHFEETEKETGNVALAAHNRGYENNYFENIKELSESDVIYYSYNGNVREYVVITHEIIRDTDWSKLENTEENMLTLITCVENQPEYRRCIQAVQILEK